MKIRRHDERGFADHGWLKSFHTFSFASYYDPANMGFSALRVINEDRVAPGRGFGTHSHADMEIISYVLEGALEHKDSIGTGSIIRPGDVQRMTAGTGVAHSEYNASKTDEVHFLQIWIMPDKRGHEPGYEQKTFDDEAGRGKLRLVGSSDGRDGSLVIHQDMQLYATRLETGETASYDLVNGRKAWVHIARGKMTVNGTELDAGDAAAIVEPGKIDLRGAGGEALLFDLP